MLEATHVPPMSAAKRNTQSTPRKIAGVRESELRIGQDELITDVNFFKVLGIVQVNHDDSISSHFKSLSDMGSDKASAA
jgi:hypothetical protein